MYVFTLFNMIADLAILWLILCVSKTEDKSHPLASLVSITAAPYAAHLYPMIVMTATIPVTREFHSVVNQAESFRVMIDRDNRFMSIMLSTVLFILYFGGACCIEGIVRSILNDQELTTPQVRRRVLIPMCIGMCYSMAFFNNMFSIDNTVLDTRKYNNGPILGLFVFSVFAAAIVLIYGTIRFKTLNRLSDHQKKMMKCFTSFQLFFVISIVPMLYIMYSMGPRQHNYGFLFSDYSQFVRLIVVLGLLTLEPISARLRGFQFRNSLYRTGADGQPDEQAGARYAQQQPNSVVPTNSQNGRNQAPPLPKKETGEPPVYDQLPLPTYDNANSMRMTAPWETSEVSLDDVKLKKGMVPVDAS